MTGKGRGPGWTCTQNTTQPEAPSIPPAAAYSLPTSLPSAYPAAALLAITTMSSTTGPRFPLLPILVACASALAHKRLSSFPEHGHFAVVALILAVGFGTYFPSLY